MDTTKCVAATMHRDLRSLYAQLDSARTYSGGTSEEILGEVGWQQRGLVMDTKLYPNAVRATTLSISHERSFATVQRALGTARCDSYFSQS